MGSKSSAPEAPRTPVEAPNTLRSRATARILDAIACGPCVGLADGARSIYYNGVPLVSADGTINQPGVTWEQRTGTPDQDFIPGFPMVESELADGLPTRIRAGALNGITRSILDSDANAVRVTVGVEQIFEQDLKTGDTNGSRVDFVIFLRTRGQAWVQYPQVIEGKQMGPYQIGYRFPLPGPGPWDIRVERVTPDPTGSNVQNTLLWSSYTSIIDAKLTYPNTGLVGHTFDAELTGNSIPSREFDWIGWICRVPINYDPINRTYSGIWDGRFKFAWTDNPAWLLYQLLTSPDGAGLDDSYIDRFSLYPIAQYCDQFVPSGFAGDNGEPLFEPRFTSNFVINTKTEAYAVINSLASTFRGMTYWGSGAVQVVQDAPRDPDIIVSAANTIDGFTYAGSAQRARHSVILVSYVDAEDNYSRKVEAVENRDLIQKLGWEPLDVVAFACSSRGQAHRLGKWMLYTEAQEGETVTYRCSIDHMNVAPGSVIMVADPDYAGAPVGGRVASANGSSVRIDRPILIEAGKVYNINVTLPDGKLAKRRLTNSPGAHQVMTFAQPLPAVPQVESMWAIDITDLQPRMFRVVSVQENSKTEFTVTALLHDPTKYPQVELGLRFEPPVFSRLQNPGIVQSPGPITVSREYISTPNGWTTALQVSWEPSGDAYTRGYLLRYEKNRANWITMPEVTATTQTIFGESAGHFVFHVQTINFAGIPSRPSIYEVDILDESPITLISPTGLELEGQGNDNVFNGRNPKFVWRATAIRGSYPPGQEPAAGAGYLDSIFRDYQVRVYAMTGTLIFTDETVETTYTFDFEKNARTPGGPHRHFIFEVVMRDKWGNVSKPARLEAINPPPAQPTGLEVTAGYAAYFIRFNRPADLDFEGTLVWASTTSGYEPNDSLVVYDGPNTFIVVNAQENVVQYVRLAGYDSFGKFGLNVTAEIAVRPVGTSGPDFDPPDVPRGLLLRSTATVQPDGSTLYELIAEWEANSDEDLLQYELALREEGGNDVFFTSASPVFRITAVAGVAYLGRIRAWDSTGNFSGYSDPPVRHVVGGDTIPPSTPTSLTLKPDFKGVWMEWLKPPEPDFYYMEVWESSSNDRGQAILIGRHPGTEFNRRDLGPGVERWFWIRAVDRSGNMSGFFPAAAGMRARTLKIEEADYAELSIGKGILGEAIITDANIDELSASVLKAGTALAGSITVNGQQIGESLGAATDPAAVINLKQTQIDPGRILIGGGTSLANWRAGGDTTKIDGGNIFANSIRANSLSIGNRNLDLLGCAFEFDRKSNILSWTAGTMIFEPDAPSGHGAENITAGSVPWIKARPDGTLGGDITYIVWARGWGELRWTTNPDVYGDPAQVVVCTWYGDVGFHALLGRTIIHGDTITTGTINANRIQANSITAAQLSATQLITQTAQIGDGIITRAKIGKLEVADADIVSLRADKITAGSLTSQRIEVGGATGFGVDRSKIVIEGQSGYHAIRYHDQNGITRVEIGQNAPTPDVNRDGMIIRGVDGRILMHANGFGVQIMGTDQLRAATSTVVHDFPNSVRGGFISQPSSQGIPNRTLWTIHLDNNPNSSDTDNIGNSRFRLFVPGIIAFEWTGDNFPANKVIDVPAGTGIPWVIQIYRTFSDGSALFVEPEATVGPDPIWSPSVRNRTNVTVLEVKR